MSKLVQIERALQAINDATFQRLSDAYLYQKGYKNLNSLGLVVGADKTTRGTPDTLITQADGKYIFAEQSTQQTELAAKFSSDLAKCFNTEKTGIPLERIREIILCHNSKLSANEEQDLGEACRSHGIMLRTFGLSQIAHDLYQSFPGLAKDFLGISVDTGQIVSPDDFVAAYDRGTLATPLRTTFRFREGEIERLLADLDSGDGVLVSGRPGVGKSRLALEACTRFSKARTTFQVLCIRNLGPDLFEDLRVHFSAPGDYIILVDDANRVTRFEYVLQLLHEPRADRRVKIVATIRDYALQAVLDRSSAYRLSQINLERLSDEQINELVREEFGVRNGFYLERIARIAEGNPRLAVMAARIATKANTLESISDVSALYDEYFRGIRQDIEDFPDQDLLKAAAIIAFFRFVDRADKETMAAIESAFGMTDGTFWDAARRLHELEAVDMYENEVVRVSDQVLATYLFYVAVFQERVLSLAAIFEHFFPRLRHRFIEALNPVLAAFSTETVMSVLRPEVERAWHVLSKGNEQDFLHLVDLFWFVRPSDSLVFAQEKIARLEPDPRPVDRLDFKEANESVSAPSVLSILSRFSRSDRGEMRSAIELLLEYLDRRPGEVPLVIRLLNESFGIDHQSALSRFAVPLHAVEVLAEKAQAGKNELYSRLLLAFCKPLLNTHFQTTGSFRGNALTFYRFDVPASEPLRALRRAVWEQVLGMYRAEPLRGAVLDVIYEHSRNGFHVANADLVTADATQVLAFFDQELQPSDYWHCVVVHSYLDLLSRLHVSFDPGIATRFTNGVHQLSELLFDDRMERVNIGWEEFQKEKTKRILNFVEGLDQTNIADLLGQCLEIRAQIGSGRDHYEFENGVRELLLALGAKDPQLFARTIEEHLHAGNPLNLSPYGLISKLISIMAPDRCYEMLVRTEFPGKLQWLSAFFVALPADVVPQRWVPLLYEFYDKATAGDLVADLDHLLKFAPYDPKVVQNVVRRLVEKAKAEPNIGHILSAVVNSHSELGQKAGTIFSDDSNLLKRSYLAACGINRHTDHDGAIFDVLLTLDPAFARDWVQWMFDQKDWISRHDDHRDYSVIWRRSDHQGVADELLTAVTKQSAKGVGTSSYLEVFFRLPDGAGSEDLRKRQDEYIDRVISRNAQDSDVMEVVFAIVSGFGPERRRARFAAFLRQNQDVKVFERLPVEPNGFGWTGSAVPMLQERIEFLQTLLPLVDTLPLLRHRQIVELRIQALREEVEAEKRRDFLHD